MLTAPHVSLQPHLSQSISFRFMKDKIRLNTLIVSVPRSGQVLIVYVLHCTTDRFILHASCQLGFHHIWRDSVSFMKDADDSADQRGEHQYCPVNDDWPETLLSYRHTPVEYWSYHDAAGNEYG